MWRRALKMAFWAAYDNMGRWILLSMLWALAVAVPLSAGLAFLGAAPWAMIPGVAAAWLAAWAVGGGLAAFARAAIDTHDATLADFWDGLRRHGPRAAALGLAYLTASVMLGVSVWFYAARMPWGPDWLRMTLSAAAFWLLVFLGLTAPFALAALVMKPAGPWTTWKLAAALTVRHPGMAIGTAVLWIGLTVAAVIVPPLLVFALGGLSAATAVSAYEMIARRHAAEAGKTVIDDAQDDLLNRGVRDLLFPWKS